jgi:hypothetical protein
MNSIRRIIKISENRRPHTALLAKLILPDEEVSVCRHP